MTLPAEKTGLRKAAKYVETARENLQDAIRRVETIQEETRGEPVVVADYASLSSSGNFHKLKVHKDQEVSRTPYEPPEEGVARESVVKVITARR
jgi:hypothetical protein